MNERPSTPCARALRLALLAAGAGLLLACGANAGHHEKEEAPKQPALQRTPAPAGVELYFITPRDGEILSSPVTVRFGLRGMGVSPAGLPRTGTGHHHLIIDAPTPPLGQPVPSDDNHLHFGGGQTEVEITLAPGDHTLQLVLGDHIHLPHDPPVVSERINITVE